MQSKQTSNWKKSGSSVGGRASRFSFLISVLILALGAQTSFLFTQQPCSFFEFNPASASFAAGGGNGAVACDQGVVTNGVYTGCGWTAASNVGWIVINSGATSDKTGFGSVNYTVLPNPSALSRVGTMTFSNGNYLSATYTVTQAGGNQAPSGAPLSSTPAALIFYYQRGKALPATQTLGVSTNPGNSLFSISATTNKGGSWLLVGASSDTSANDGTATEFVSVSPVGLTPGIYTGDVVIAPPASNSVNGVSQREAVATVSTPVTLTVSDSPQPSLVSPTVLQFNYNPAAPGALPPPQTVTITSSSGAPTPFTLSTCVLTPATGANWLSIGARTPPTVGFLTGAAVTLTSALQNSVSGVTPATINISINPVALRPGRYVALLRFNSTATCPTAPAPPTPAPTPTTPSLPTPSFPSVGDILKPLARGAAADQSNLAAAIILSVGNGTLITSAPDITFGSDTPPLQSADVFVNGGGLAVLPSIISLNAPDGWLTMNPITSSGTPAHFDISAAATDITLQQYNGILVFSDSSGVTGTVITVEAIPGSSANAWHCTQQLASGRNTAACAVNFSATFGAAAAPQSITITNSSTTSMAVVVNSDKGWLSIPSAATSPGPLTFAASTAGLGTGNYGGSITISGDGVNAPPMVIPVGLAIQ